MRIKFLHRFEAFLFFWKRQGIYLLLCGICDVLEAFPCRHLLHDGLPVQGVDICQVNLKLHLGDLLPEEHVVLVYDDEGLAFLREDPENAVGKGIAVTEVDSRESAPLE